MQEFYAKITRENLKSYTAAGIVYSIKAVRKGEPGANPGRPRHCERGISFQVPLGFILGRRKEVVIRESGDLPGAAHTLPSLGRGDAAPSVSTILALLKGTVNHPGSTFEGRGLIIDITILRSFR